MPLRRVAGRVGLNIASKPEGLGHFRFNIESKVKLDESI
jgi:hypothetical protein